MGWADLAFPLAYDMTGMGIVFMFNLQAAARTAGSIGFRFRIYSNIGTNEYSEYEIPAGTGSPYLKEDFSCVPFMFEEINDGNEEGNDYDGIAWTAGAGGHFDPSAGIQRVDYEVIGSPASQNDSVPPDYWQMFLGFALIPAGGFYEPGWCPVYDDALHTPFTQTDSDGLSSVDHLELNGYRAAFALIADAMSDTQSGNKLGWNQARELHERGHEMGIHTGPNLPSQPGPSNQEKAFQLLELIQLQKSIFEEKMGFSPRFFVYSSNNYTGASSEGQKILLEGLKEMGIEIALASGQDHNNLHPIFRDPTYALGFNDANIFQGDQRCQTDVMFPALYRVSRRSGEDPNQVATFGDQKVHLDHVKRIGQAAFVSYHACSVAGSDPVDATPTTPGSTNHTLEEVKLLAQKAKNIGLRSYLPSQFAAMYRASARLKP